uniref:Uncharacterized protein n=1 Tax=Tetranychus urticae TaxID=32264 RepID=T1L5E4_TETUR
MSWNTLLYAGLFLDVLTVAIVKAAVGRRISQLRWPIDCCFVGLFYALCIHASRAVYITWLFNYGSFWSQLIWILSIEVGLSRIVIGRLHVFDVLLVSFLP